MTGEWLARIAHNQQAITRCRDVTDGLIEEIDALEEENAIYTQKIQNETIKCHKKEQNEHTKKMG